MDLIIFRGKNQRIMERAVYLEQEDLDLNLPLQLESIIYKFLKLILNLMSLCYLFG